MPHRFAFYCLEYDQKKKMNVSSKSQKMGNLETFYFVLCFYGLYGALCLVKRLPIMISIKTNTLFANFRPRGLYRAKRKQ